MKKRINFPVPVIHFGIGNGDRIRLNTLFFSKSTSRKIQDVYKQNTEGWIKKLNEKVEIWEKRSKALSKQISDAEKRNDQRAVAWHKANKKGWDKLRKDAEDLLNAGHTRHNAFMSEDALLRNVVQHESGHTIDDMLLGTLNGNINRIQDRLSTDEIKKMDVEITALHNKYRNYCGWLSTYGAKRRDEFLAECMVIYSDKGGEGLPEDVKAWFDKLKMLSRRKIK